jgi:hypothetical protein
VEDTLSNGAGKEMMAGGYPSVRLRTGLGRGRQDKFGIGGGGGAKSWPVTRGPGAEREADGRKARSTKPIRRSHLAREIKQQNDRSRFKNEVAGFRIDYSRIAKNPW